MPVLVRYGGRSSLEEDELAAIQIESTHTIDIDNFVPREEIDRRLMDALRESLKGERGGGRAQKRGKGGTAKRRSKSAARRRKAA